MKIAVDIDGVLRDSITKMVEIYNKHFNTDMSVNDVKMYDVEKSFPLIRSALGISPHDFFFVTFDNEIKAIITPIILQLNNAHIFYVRTYQKLQYYILIGFILLFRLHTCILLQIFTKSICFIRAQAIIFHTNRRHQFTMRTATIRCKDT